MVKIFLKNWPVILLLFLALLTRFIFLSYPSEVVFDEVHFGKFVSSYFNHEYYFDIHPPLGKLMIAGFFWISNKATISDPEKTFSQIGENLDKNILFSLRFLPAFFGALLVVLVYKLVIVFGFSKKSAFLAGFLVLFDNAFLVQSKFILVDIFLVFFGTLSLYFYFLYRKKPILILFILSAIFAAFSFSIKWTGLSFYFLIFIAFLVDTARNFKIRDFIVKTLILIIIPFLVYLLVFVIHFKILSEPGSGDTFMNRDFQNLNLWQKFIELNQTMLKRNSEIKVSHPFSSKWYQWPIIKKPIFYWLKNLNGRIGNIYLLGNPLVWWPVLVSIIFSFFIILRRKFRRKLPLLFYFFLSGYFINLLPYIAISRVTFLYHYLPSLLFGILILVFFWEKVISPSRFSYYLIFLALVFFSFLVLSPLTYGFLISPKANEIYNILIKFLS